MKLIDFGLAFRVPRKGERSVLKFTPIDQDVWVEFRAPEIHAAEADLGYEIDVWSIGCLAYLLYVCLYPSIERNNFCLLYAK